MMNDKENSRATIAELMKRQAAVENNDSAFFKPPEVIKNEALSSSEKKDSVEIKDILRDLNMLVAGSQLGPEYNDEYRRVEDIFNSPPFCDIVSDISKELYAGGKQPRGSQILNRQMILGDIVEYIFTGRAYFFAAKSEENFKNFLKLILYCVNQLLIFDTITVNPDIRRRYIEKLEKPMKIQKFYDLTKKQKVL